MAQPGRARHVRPGQTEDRSVRFESAGRHLTGMIHTAAEPPRGPAVVFCNPFGDERKSSALAMARLARRLAGRGAAVLRFDYWGCGDSPGEFVDASVSSRVEDILAAVEFLRAQTRAKPICLLGLRLGATLAVRAAKKLRECAALALIEPVPEGAAYFEGQLRRRLVRRMITGGQGRGKAEKGEIIDLDGYAVRRRTLEEMQHLRIEPAELAFDGRVLLVQVSFNEKLRAEIVGLRRAFGAAGASVQVRALVMPPFWSHIDITDTTALEDVVSSWLGPAGRTGQLDASQTRP